MAAPMNSGFRLNTNLNPGSECFSSTPACYADVVARTLDTSAPILKDAGHVSLINEMNSQPMPKTKVFEVLNKSPVLQKNSLDSFKVTTNYWDTRYGLAGKGLLPIKKA